MLNNEIVKSATSNSDELVKEWLKKSSGECIQLDEGMSASSDDVPTVGGVEDSEGEDIGVEARSVSEFSLSDHQDPVENLQQVLGNGLPGVTSWLRSLSLFTEIQKAQAHVELQREQARTRNPRGNERKEKPAFSRVERGQGKLEGAMLPVYNEERFLIF